jgi:hypothetical protein
VSDNGSVVVGIGNSASGTEAFLWTSGGGIVSLATFLTGQGVDLTGWSSLDEAFGITGDGSTIVGYGYHNGNAEAFIVSGLTAIPEPSAYAALAGLLALGFVHWRRQRRA